MEQAGVQLIAQNINVYIGDLKSATNATNTFVDTTEKGGSVVGRAGDMMGSAIKGVATIAAGVGVAGFVALGKAIFDGLGDARESARLNAATEQTILTMGNAAGVSAQHVADMAAALSDANGASLFGDDQIQQSENLLLTFSNIKGETFDLATALTVDLAQALGGAPADQAMMLGKALNDPIKGLTALGRAGLTFSEEQQAAIKAMVETGDIAGAQALIIAELNRQVGGQAAAAAEAAGGIEQFKARMGETFETIATQLLPILNDFGDWLNSPEVTAAIDEMAAALIAAFGWAADNIPPTIKLIVDGVQDVVKWFDQAGGASDGLGGALNDLSGIWEKAREIVESVADAYLRIAEAVLPIVAGFVAEHGDEIEAFFKSTWDTIIEIINLALDLYKAIVPPILNAIAGFIEDHGSEIQKVFGGVWDAVTSLITGALETIKGVLSLALHLIQGDWEAAWEDVKKIGQAQWDAIKGFVTGFLDAIAGIFDTTLADILQTWEDNWNMAVDIVTSIDWVSLGANMVNGIIQGLRDNVGALLDFIGDMIKDAIHSAMVAAGIASPSKEFATIGEFMILGLMQGVEDTWPQMIDLVGSISSDLIDEMQDIGEQMRDAIADSFGSTATIDRQMAKNLAQIGDIQDEFTRKVVAQDLDTLKKKAESLFTDPKDVADYYKMVSGHEFETLKLREQIAKATTQEEKDRLNQQLILISRAQDAELEQFYTRTQGQQTVGEQIADSINAVMLALSGIDLTDDQIKIVDMLAGIRSTLASTPQTMYTPGYTGQTTSNTTNVNMPIYTNNSPAALQQSWAILQASMA